MEGEDKKGNYVLPASILIAALLVSLSLVYSAGKRDGGSANLGGTAPAAGTQGSLDKIQPVSADDHILGNLNAKVFIVEFSDLECPFCKSFHPTLSQVFADYGGEVAWVYRHLPLDSIHPKARKEAEASECAAELGGNNAFWAYIDRIFEVTPSNNGLNLAILPEVAQEIGLDKAKFSACLDSGKYAEKIENQLDDAFAAGARGTPFSVVIGKNGKKYPLSGALPIERVKLVVEEALAGQ